MGAYERDYPRNRVLIEGLRARGVAVREHQRPVWETVEHKSGLGPATAAALAGRAAVAWGGLAVEFLRAGRPEVVVAGYPAQPDALPTWVAAKASGALLVVDMMVSLVDTLAGDRGLAGGMSARAFAAADRLALRLADLVLCDTAAHAAFFHRRFGVPWDELVVAPVGAEPQHFPPAPVDANAPARVLFYGKLSPLHGLETVLAAARRPGVPPLRVIGDGQLGDWLADQLASDPPAGVAWERWVPYRDLAAEIAAASICLGVFGTSAKAARVVPNKVWQAMAVGRPIITADTPGVREALVDGESALLVPAGDATALAEAIVRLNGDRALAARLAAGARAAYERLGAPAAAARPLHEALLVARARRRGA